MMIWADSAISHQENSSIDKKNWQEILKVACHLLREAVQQIIYDLK